MFQKVRFLLHNEAVLAFNCTYLCSYLFASTCAALALALTRRPVSPGRLCSLSVTSSASGACMFCVLISFSSTESFHYSVYKERGGLGWGERGWIQSALCEICPRTDRRSRRWRRNSRRKKKDICSCAHQPEGWEGGGGVRRGEGRGKEIAHTLMIKVHEEGRAASTAHCTRAEGSSRNNLTFFLCLCVALFTICNQKIHICCCWCCFLRRFHWGASRGSKNHNAKKLFETGQPKQNNNTILTW